MANRAVWTLYAGLWRRVRKILLIVFAGLALAFVGLWLAEAQGLRAQNRDASEDFMIALMLIGVANLVGAAAVILSNSDAERLIIGLPDRVLRMPLRTWKLALIHLAFGASVGAVVSLAAAVPLPFVLKVEMTWWKPVLGAMAFMPIAQLWAYTMGKASPRVALVSFVLYFGSLAALVQRPWVRTLFDGSAPARGAIVFGVTLVIVTLLTCAVLVVQRRGGWAASLPRRSVTVAKTRVRRAFGSARAAQFWFEWRQYGLLLPIYVGGSAAAYFIGMPLVVGLFRATNVTGKSSGEPLFRIDWFSSAQYVWMGLFLAAFLGGLMVGGVLFMRGGHWNSNSSYLLTRPLTLTRISNARLIVIGVGGLLALMELAGIVLAIEAFVRSQGESTGFGAFLHQGYTHLPQALVVAMHFGFLYVLMWACAWPASYLFAAGAFLILLVPLRGALLGGALVGLLDPAKATEYAATGSPVAYWAGAGLAVLGLFVLAWQANRRGLLHPAVPWVCAALWLAYSWAFAHSMVQWEVPPGTKDWAQRFPHPMNWPLWVGISVVPLLPFLLHPLMLARIRHR